MIRTEKWTGAHLVGDVEEGQVALALAQVSDGAPLLPSRVDARRVVRAACRPANIPCHVKEYPT